MTTQDFTTTVKNMLMDKMVSELPGKFEYDTVIFIQDCNGGDPMACSSVLALI